MWGFSGLNICHSDHIGNSSRYRGRCPTRVGRAGALSAKVALPGRPWGLDQRRCPGPLHRPATYVLVVVFGQLPIEPVGDSKDNKEQENQSAGLDDQEVEEKRR